MAKKKKDDKRGYLYVRANDQLRDRAFGYAERHDMPVAFLTRIALEEYLDRKEFEDAARDAR